MEEGRWWWWAGSGQVEGGCGQREEQTTSDKTRSCRMSEGAASTHHPPLLPSKLVLDVRRGGGDITTHLQNKTHLRAFRSHTHTDIHTNALKTPTLSILITWEFSIKFYYRS